MSPLKHVIDAVAMTLALLAYHTEAYLRSRTIASMVVLGIPFLPSRLTGERRR